MLACPFKQSSFESGCAYAHHKNLCNLHNTELLREVNRIRRLIKCMGIKNEVSYRSPRRLIGKSNILASDLRQRHFNPDDLEESSVTVTTYILTHEDWLHRPYI